MAEFTMRILHRFSPCVPRGYTDVIFKQVREDFGIDRVRQPERFALFIDHMVPVATPKEEELHIETRQWGARQGVEVHERKGIGHQVSAELGYATPAAFAVHFDGHISQSARSVPWASKEGRRSAGRSRGWRCSRSCR